MNYIYDIYLNLNEKSYDFFEWDKTDNLVHIKRIPIFIITSNKLRLIASNNITIDDSFINKINGKTEVWTPNIKLTYCALFCDYSDIIVLQFDCNGNSIRRSNLYIDEENEVLDDIKRSKITNIQFKIKSKLNYSFKTRNQIKIESFINKELKNIDDLKLKYISYECLGITSNNKSNINRLKKLKHNSTNYKNLYNILKLTSKDLK